MTLRLRLVLALVVLVTAAQGAFFLGTYTLYRSSEFNHLDAQLRTSRQLIEVALNQEAGGDAPPSGLGFVGGQSGGAPSGGGDGRSGRPPPAIVAPGTYAELITDNGKVFHLQVEKSPATPKLGRLPKPTADGTIFTAPSSSGSGSFRVLVNAGGDNSTTVIAIPTTGVDDALHRLVLIEAAAVAALLIVLSGGSWLVLRRGLRPLERIAATARTISSGDLSQRVSPSGGASEVGQLGLALNTMLGDIEVAFAERRATEDRLRQFLADASHELRTPLTSIQGFTELFRVSGDQARVDLPTILRRIEEESARMRVLVEDLLLLARLDQTRDVERAPVDLTVLAADACSDAVASDHDRPVRLEAPQPVVVPGDQDHLRQAVASLVANALKHTPPGTPIEVGATPEGDGALLWVRDRGDGLDATALDHVFDRFWQADEARAGHGFGLGLSIVAAIAAEHGGTATVANAAGGGAVFALHLPRRAVTPAGPSRTPASVP